MFKYVRGFIERLSLLCIVIIYSGCATYQNNVSTARNLAHSGQFISAASQIKEFAENENGDQLAYLLDYATLLYYSAEYKESIKYFLRADKLSDDLDYHSISRQAGSLLVNEEMLQYKGDSFEKIFINAFLALNYLALGETDEALVEARRINQKFLKLTSDEKKSYEINSFGKYLSAILWESDRKFDDAYLAYKEAYNLDQNIFGIEQDLLRSSQKAQRWDEYKKWKNIFSNVQENTQWKNSENGEVVVFFLQGWGPKKVFNPQDVRFPILRPSYSESYNARINILDKYYSTSTIYNVQDIAIQSLKEDYGYLVAKRIGSYVAKEVMADQVRQKNEALGFIAWLFLHASDRADLRQWSQLPKTIQMARIYLTPGEYNIEAEVTSYDGQTLERQPLGQSVKVKKGKISFLSWKSKN